jgi:hypothetical protein
MIRRGKVFKAFKVLNDEKDELE